MTWLLGLAIALFVLAGLLIGQASRMEDDD